MTHPGNHKTVFVLDHTPYFGTDCEKPFELDFIKPRNPGVIPLAPILKSIWTSTVECSVEYCRIVWDLFPTGKLIRFIVSDSKAHCLNGWSSSQQCINSLLNGLATIDLPPKQTEGSNFSVLYGLLAAVQAMCECSEPQHEIRTSLNENAPTVVNKGRIICITALSNEAIKQMEEKLKHEILEQNKVATSSDILIPIDHCDLVFLNLLPGAVEDVPAYEVSALLKSETHCVKDSTDLSVKLSCLILKHYDLASTTVTGIPMKEEQNASSSANYDVEIFHAAAAHASIFKGGNVDVGAIKTKKEGCDYETVTLKWCTPRGCSTLDTQHCTVMHRITPVDVNSRPSSCLINFLLGGRSVMLEVARRGGSKSLCHLLVAHAGQIYMHSLAVGRSLLDDSPSLSEGVGGRVTDYRITDFGLLMQQNKLVPLKSSSKTITSKRVRSRLDHFTKYWPLTISSTIIFNYKQYLEPILSIIMLQQELRDSDVQQCKQCIYSLISAEAKQELNNSGNQRSKGPKRDDQNKQMWTELETFLRAHCVSEKHISILNCLLEVRNRSRRNAGADGSETIELDQALKELDQMPSSSSYQEERASVIRSVAESPLSPGAPAPTSGSKPANTVLDLWVSSFCQIKPRPDFDGLSGLVELTGAGVPKVKLYSNLVIRDRDRDRDRERDKKKPKICD